MSLDSLIESMARELGELRRQIEQLAAHEVGTGWQTWTPTVTQGVAVAATVTYARYMKVGKLIIVTGQLDVTAAGTNGQAVVIGGLPVACVRTANLAFGVGSVTDVGTGCYQGAASLATATTFQFTTHNGWSIGITPAFALANGDLITFAGMYEIA